ncbi:hypothetical protein [Niallia sp. 03133]
MKNKIRERIQAEYRRKINEKKMERKHTVEVCIVAIGIVYFLTLFLR